MDENVRYHETNEGREVNQAIAGFEGTNAIWFIAAIGLSMLLFRQSVDYLQLSMIEGFAIASLPFVVVSLYVFGLKQGKPKSYDLELGQWLMFKITRSSYFSPKQVQPLEIPWVDTDKEASQWPKSPTPTSTKT